MADKRVMRMVIGAGAGVSVLSLPFFFAAIWAHGHDAVTRLAGTGGIIIAVGILLLMVGGFGSME